MIDSGTKMSDTDAKAEPKRELDYINILFKIHLLVLGIYGALLVFTAAKWMTVFFLIFLVLISSLGLTAGAHRLWAHQTYVATGPLKFFLMLAHTMAGVGPIFNWVKLHRLHHKHYGTDKDPYNHKKGFLYSHVYSNLLKYHPDTEELIKEIDMRDVDGDIYIWLQRIFYWILFMIFGVLLPINAPVEYWGESLATSICVVGFLRIAITMQIAWLINSALLVWGLHEGEKYPPDDNSILILNKSFWPYYHYLLPWDVECGEFGKYGGDWSTLFIKICYVTGLISHMVIVKSENIRETLYEIAMKRKSLTKGLNQLEEECQLDAIEAELQLWR